ncbi:hypothetical protein KBX06_12480 [Micromonospora sp. C31]|uniref:hypothetical protein n=1 Tax=Micromonospora sp. C31 TaxID=2824876 RepID=UPI001B36027E|nr:hypothetical protein [Micromonospora sp. C31]MBQ1073971.1 hypothetical protein [Micromonospora sp. C31]
MSATLHRARRLTARALTALLTAVLSVTLVTVGTGSPALAAPVSVQGDRMIMAYTSWGSTYNVGWYDYRLSLDYVNGRPSVYGAILAIQPYNGWNAVGYGSQTLVSCTNNLWSGSYYYSRCYVKAKMEKPGNVVGSITGSYRGVTFSGGYDSGSGRSYMFFTGEVTVRRDSAGQPYTVCYVYGNARCVTYSAP